jgi:predicted metal-binding protein
METGFPVNESVSIMNYDEKSYPDFYHFYNKLAVAINDGDYYSVVTVIHPLAGFNTGDILPESVCCLNFHPKCKNWDGMVYCNTIEKFVDIYLQSGTSRFTESRYGAVHTVNRQWLNYQCDMQTVGKSMLTFSEFMQVAMGSNERTAIAGFMDYITVGGHVDTANRRMISFIGCEECCGYMIQWIMSEAEKSQVQGEIIDDGRGFMGITTDGIITALGSGGCYLEISSSDCGSRSVDISTSWSYINKWRCCRGITNLSIV